MCYRDVKQKLWKRTAYIARRHTGFRAVMIAWLAVYFWNRLIVRWVCRRPQALPAFLTAFCLVFAAPGSVWADVVLHEQIMSGEEDLETGRLEYQLDVDVTAPEGTTPENSEQPPEYAVKLTNTGSADLTGLSAWAALDNAEDSEEAFVLYFEENGLRYEVLPSDIGITTPSDGESEKQEESTEKTEESTEEPQENTEKQEESTEKPQESTESAEENPGTSTEDSGAQGGEPMDQSGPAEDVTPESNAGGEPLLEQSAISRLSAREAMLMKAVAGQRALPDTLSVNASITIYVALPLGRGSGSVSGTCCIQTNELAPYNFPLLFTIEPGGNDTGEWDTPEESEPSEDESEPQTPEEDRKEESGEEGPSAEDTDSLAECVERPIGYSQGNMFFARGVAQYTVQMPPESTVTELCYRIAGCTGAVRMTEEGTAVIAIPEDTDGWVEIYYVDEAQREVFLVQEYVIYEKSAPMITHEIVKKDGRKYAQITIEETGNVISGLNNTYMCIDGEIVEDLMAEPLAVAVLSNGSEVLSAQQYEIPLDDEEEHSFEMVVEDGNGNVALDYFIMSAARDDIIRVVLPTSFKISLLPNDQDIQLYGENIVLQNKSEFPISVNIASAEVLVDHTIPENATLSQTLFASDSSDVTDLRRLAEQNKDCNLSMNLMCAEDSNAKNFALKEGITSDIASFILAPGDADAETVEVQRYGMERPRSLNYAVLNLRGTVDKSTTNCWETGDIKVKIIFKFNKEKNGPVAGYNSNVTGTLDVGELPEARPEAAVRDADAE